MNEINKKQRESKKQLQERLQSRISELEVANQDLRFRNMHLEIEITKSEARLDLIKAIVDAHSEIKKEE